MMGYEFQAEFFARYPVLEGIMGLFDHAPGMFFYAKTRDSRFVRVNRANQAIYGVTCEESLLGRTDRNFHPPALAEAYIAEDQRVMETGKPSSNQVWLVPYIDGASQWFNSSKTPLRDKDGTIVGVAGVMYPIATPHDQQHRFGQLAPAIALVEKNFRDPLTMSDLARSCKLSSTHFNRLFRTLFRLSPTRYLLAVRVQEARRMLADPRKGLVDIALDTGFYDQSHFTKRFKHATGLTPTEYRRQIVQGSFASPVRVH